VNSDLSFLTFRLNFFIFLSTPDPFRPYYFIHYSCCIDRPLKIDGIRSLSPPPQFVHLFSFSKRARLLPQRPPSSPSVRALFVPPFGFSFLRAAVTTNAQLSICLFPPRTCFSFPFLVQASFRLFALYQFALFSAPVSRGRAEEPTI